MDLTTYGKETVFIWAPGHVGIRSNSAADSAAEGAFFSLATSRLKSWDEFSENKLHELFPNLKECIVCLRTKRKQETVIAALVILLSLPSFYSRVRNHQCAQDVMNDYLLSTFY